MRSAFGSSWNTAIRSWPVRPHPQTPRRHPTWDRKDRHCKPGLTPTRITRSVSIRHLALPAHFSAFPWRRTGWFPVSVPRQQPSTPLDELVPGRLVNRLPPQAQEQAGARVHIRLAAGHLGSSAAQNPRLSRLHPAFRSNREPRQIISAALSGFERSHRRTVERGVEQRRPHGTFSSRCASCRDIHVPLRGSTRRYAPVATSRSAGSVVQSHILGQEPLREDAHARPHSNHPRSAIIRPLQSDRPRSATKQLRRTR